jgi:uncharacterized protein (DUF1330 family)
MPTLQITQMCVLGPAALRAYATKAQPIVNAYGGRLRALSVDDKSRTVVEGSWDAEAVITVHEWPDRGVFEAFYSSPEYVEARALRNEGAVSDMIIIDTMD